MNSTTNYEIFKILNYNRPVVPYHVNNLKKSILKQNLLHLKPIIVNNKMEVIDGQHRLQAAKELGLEVYYIMENTADVGLLPSLNTNMKNWILPDFHRVYVKEMQLPEYLKFDEFMKKHNLLVFPALCLLAKPGKINAAMHEFRNKEFIFDTATAERVGASYSYFCESVRKNRAEHIEFLRGSTFCIAFTYFISSEEIDIDRLIEQVLSYPSIISNQLSRSGAVDNLVYLYNYNRKHRVHIKYRATYEKKKDKD